MNPITITYDAEKYQLVPKKLTPDQIKAIQVRTEIGAFVCDNWVGAYDLIQELFNAALVAAPQPETLSPWLPTGMPSGTTHLDAGPSRNKWLRITQCLHDYWEEAESRWVTFEGGHNTLRKHWIPLPQEPKPEQGK